MLRLQGALEQAQAEAKSHADALLKEPVASQSVNVSKRSLALRMHRRGETPEQIAATLSIPRNEVELLLKVHKSVLEQA